MLNHIWNLFTKARALWVAWTEANWLKGRSLWQVFVPLSCSWSQKKILKLRDIAKSFIRYKVGDGRRVFLWWDHWHPAAYLLDTFGFRVVYDSGLSLNIKLASLIKNGDCFWSHAHSDALVEIQGCLYEVMLSGDDMPVWNSRSGKYFCTETWENLRETGCYLVEDGLVSNVYSHACLSFVAYFS